VVENGLFLGIADAAVLGGRDGITVLSASYGEEAEAS
jgi:ribose 5-phosphate isomerase A